MKNLGDYETESNQIPVVFKEFKDKIVLNIRVKNLMFYILVGKKKVVSRFLFKNQDKPGMKIHILFSFFFKFKISPVL